MGAFFYTLLSQLSLSSGMHFKNIKVIFTQHLSQHEIYYIIFGYPNSFISRRITAFMKKIFAWRLTRAGRPDLVPVLTPGIVYPDLDMFLF